MAGQLCHGGSFADDAMQADCHGMSVDNDSADEPSCPGSDVVPDLGKLATVAPLPAGHDFSLAISFVAATEGLAHSLTRSRDGPDLDTLCRLLI